MATSSESRFVPDTPLRELYRLLGDLERMGFHLEMAREWARGPNPAKLADRFVESVAAFETYSNVEESMVGTGRKAFPKVEDILTVTCTEDVAALIRAQDRVEVIGESNMTVRYVDREVTPARTTGLAAGRQPQLDLLLANVDGTPALCEVKIGDDANPFYGLVQGLMYAAELSTGHQRRRLATHYPEAFRNLAEAPVDLYILVDGYNRQSQVRQDLLEVTLDLIGKLARGTAIGRYVRRIEVLEGSLTLDGIARTYVLGRSGNAAR